jgi:hypothetical protein
MLQKRNPHAKALQSRLFRQQVVPSRNKERKIPVAKGEPELVDVVGTLRSDRPLSYMVFFGDYKIDPETKKKSEVWVALPKSLVEFDGDDVFTMPSWLCVEKGLDNAVV